MNELSGHAAYAWVTEEQARLAREGDYCARGEDWATPYYVAADIWELIVAHAPEVPNFELTRALLPTASGFIRLPEPIDHVSSVEWRTGVHSGPPSLQRLISGDALSESVFFNFFMTNGDDCGVAEHEHKRLMSERAAFAFGVPVIHDLLPDASDEIRRAVNGAQHLFASIVAFMGQSFIEVGNVAAPRYAQKRIDRGSKEPSNLKVITLRRARATGHEPSNDGREYSHRFIVRGHWHQYWMGHRGEQSRVPRFVAPYVKGPEDKPLHVPEKTLFSVVR